MCLHSSFFSATIVFFTKPKCEVTTHNAKIKQEIFDFLLKYFTKTFAKTFFNELQNDSNQLEKKTVGRKKNLKISIWGFFNTLNDRQEKVWKI